MELTTSQRSRSSPRQKNGGRRDPFTLGFTVKYCCGRTPLTGERAQATLRGRPRGRLGFVGSGKGCLRGRPRGRFGSI